jgi:hypothetical protein
MKSNEMVMKLSKLLIRGAWLVVRMMEEMIIQLQINPETMQSKPSKHPSLHQSVEERANNISKPINNKLKMKLRLETRTHRSLVAKLLGLGNNA